MTAVLKALINVDFGETLVSASVGGTEVRMRARLLKGNDRHSPIIVSRPWIFGSFPVRSSRKAMTEELQVLAPGLRFTYHGTNANDAVFEFQANQIR